MTLKNVTTIKPTPKNFKDGANLLFRGLIICERLCVKHEQSGKLSFSNRFIVYVWTGENDAKKLWVDANLFWRRRKKVTFTNEYGYVWTGPKCFTIQLTVRAWSHEPGKQCAWTVCYPLSCFSLGSFAGPPGKRDYLENDHQGTRYHKVQGFQLTGLAGLSYNRKVDFCCV